MHAEPDGETSRGGPAGILILCTANVCRSPMAEALLARELAARGQPARVSSAGVAARSGDSAPRAVAAVMAGYGLDVTGHRSRPVTPAELDSADLILALAREHLREAVVLAPSSWPRAFTLRELARRGTLVGPRRPPEALPAWLSRAHEGRTRTALLGDAAPDDIADPIGGHRSDYQRAAADIHTAVTTVATLAWGNAGQSRPPRLPG